MGTSRMWRFARRLAGEGAVTRHRDGLNQRGVYGRRRIVRCRKIMVRDKNRVLVSDSQSRHRRWWSLCAASTVCAPPDPMRWTCAGGSQFVTTWSKMNLFRRGKGGLGRRRCTRDDLHPACARRPNTRPISIIGAQDDDANDGRTSLNDDDEKSR